MYYFANINKHTFNTMSINYKLLIITALAALSVTANGQESATDSSTVITHNLEEVTVICNPKIMSERFELPGSITMVNENTIRQMNITSIKDLSWVASNVYIPDYGSNLITSAYIRGIGSRINSPAVGMSVNNMPYLDKSAYDIDLLDVARIEVLRGPQGTLYGHNTMAGLINVYTHSPLAKQGYRVELGAGNYGSWKVSGVGSDKITDNLGISVGIKYEEHDGYYTNTFTNKSSGNAYKANGRLQLDWQSSQREKWSLTGSYEHSYQDGYPYAAYDMQNGNIGEISYNSPSDYRRDLLTAGLQMEYRNDNFLLTSTTGYQYLDDHMRMDQDFTTMSIFTLEQKQRLHAITQEIALRGNDNEHFGWTAGVYGSYQDLHVDAPVNFLDEGITYLIEGTSNAAMAAAKLQNPKMPDITIDVANSNLYIDGKYYTPSYSLAAFGQMEAKRIFDSNFTFAVGARLEYESMRLKHSTHTSENMSGTATVGMGQMTLPIPYSAALGIDGEMQQESVELLPKFELKYILNDDFMAYVSASRGYRSGGYNYQAFSNLIQAQMRGRMINSVGENAANMILSMMGDTPMSQGIIAQINGIFAGLAGNGSEINVEEAIAYKPEYSWNYELGVRGNMWNNRINAELSLFYIDCRNQQLSTVSGYGRVTRNSGRTESYGLEASIGITPIDNLRLTASYGYTHATFKEYELGNAGEAGYINYTGNYVPFAPMHSIAVTGAYTLELAREHYLTLSAQCNGNGKIYWTEANNAVQPLYALLNASLTYEWNWLEVSLWGKNLTGTRYNTFYFETTNAINLASPNAFAQQGRPLTFGANIAFKF